VTINIFQQRVLDVVAEFAGRFDCIKALYVFGSVARGETSIANDIDICVEYGPQTAAHFSDSFTAFQGAFEDWAVAVTELFGRPVRFHNIYLSDPKDAAWDAVMAAARVPAAAHGKAVLAATPRTKSAP
jgi:predicted nucleotidyltransferase